jgi:hypothetical protein
MQKLREAVRFCWRSQHAVSRISREVDEDIALAVLASAYLNFSTTVTFQ